MSGSAWMETLKASASGVADEAQGPHGLTDRGTARTGEQAPSGANPLLTGPGAGASVGRFDPP